MTVDSVDVLSPEPPPDLFDRSKEWPRAIEALLDVGAASSVVSQLRWTHTTTSRGLANLSDHRRVVKCPACRSIVSVIFMECPTCGIRTFDHAGPIVAVLDTNVFLADIKLRKKSRVQSVPVFTPLEYYRGKLDETDAIAKFLDDFKRKAQHYVEAWSRSRRKKLGRQVEPSAVERMGDFLILVHGYYRIILLGEVEGRTDPIALSIVATTDPPSAF